MGDDETPELRALRSKARGRQAFQFQGRTVYEWEQELDEVHIYIQPPPGITKDLLDIKIKPKHVEVGMKGNPPFLNEAPFSLVDVDASFWMIEDGELHLVLGKARKGETWHSALTGHGKLDMFTEQEVQKKIMLERFQEENPGFDFSNAQFNGNCPDARDFMGGVKYT